MADKTWIYDDCGNRCSVEYFGSEEAARSELGTLKGCSRCSDCSGCSGCSDCSDCSGCSDCSDCSGCSRCSRCSGCSGCSRCSRCSDLENCSPQPRSETSPVTLPVSIPLIPKIHSAVYAAACQPGALDMRDWHTCETTHCRAGWVITLAGEEGARLEKFHGPLLAAQLIYRESGYLINPGKFLVGNAEAMADMKRLAEQEATGVA